MKLPSFINISKPTKDQIKHDIWVICSAFVGGFVASCQVQPNQISKAAIVAGASAGFAAAVTVVKRIITTL